MPRIIDHLSPDSLRQEARLGLLDARPPATPAALLYDDTGSALFDLITTLPEYYQTRIELGILAHNAAAILARVQPQILIELGSGVGEKIRRLLDTARRRVRRVVFVDVNRALLDQSVAKLAELYPGLEVMGLQADFRNGIAYPDGATRLVLFFAGTFGNMRADQARSFLARTAAALQPGEAVLIGLDLIKSRARLEAAYNDAQGVTEAFNKNVLLVLNRLFSVRFDPDDFDHRAIYDEQRCRIEMHLVARRPVRVPLDGELFALEPGEHIRTEVSCKYDRERLEALLDGVPLSIARWDCDSEQLFALALLERS